MEQESCDALAVVPNFHLLKYVLCRSLAFHWSWCLLRSVEKTRNHPIAMNCRWQVLKMLPMNLIYVFVVLVWDALTENLRLGGLNHRYLFIIVLRAGSLRSRCQQMLCLVSALFCVCRPPSQWVSQNRGQDYLSSLLSGMISTVRALPSQPNLLPRPYLKIVEIQNSASEFGRHIQFIALIKFWGKNWWERWVWRRGLPHLFSTQRESTMR